MAPENGCNQLNLSSVCFWLFGMLMMLQSVCIHSANVSFIIFLMQYLLNTCYITIVVVLPYIVSPNDIPSSTPHQIQDQHFRWKQRVHWELYQA